MLFFHYFSNFHFDLTKKNDFLQEEITKHNFSKIKIFNNNQEIQENRTAI
jgi:hypothetical protein